MAKTVKRLYETFQPTHYTLHIAPDSKTMHFTGTIEIKGKKVGRPSQRFTFHQNGLKITKATAIKHDKKGDETVDIVRINNQNTLHEVRLHSDKLLYPGDYTIYMEFEAPITRGMTGLYPCFFKHNGEEKVLLATQFESHHAREVFPCIDEPEAKATFDLSITAPSELTVLGNTPVKETTSPREGFTTTTFETSPRMSSYLLAFVIGEIHKKSAKTKSGVEVNVWGTIAQPAESFDFALDTAVRSIEFFEDYFKVPYPLAKADHVALPDFSSGAMENWGLITYREVLLLLYPDAVSQSAKEHIALVIAHETSHQWFGNLVTMQWWDDLWLNESFANMMEYAAVDALFPEWNIWENFITAEGLSAFRRDAVPGVQAIKTTVRHPDEISTLFDPSIVYAKGGRLLYMLKNYLGDEIFRQGLQKYFTKHAYKNTTGADLWEALSEASGKDIASFMNPWLERSGFPVVSVKQQDNTLELAQQHFSDNPEKADKNRLWPVPLFAERGDVPPLLEKANKTAALETDTFVLLNQGGKGHYITQYLEEAHRNHLISLIETGKLATIDRLMLLTNSSMLARAGYQSFAETLKLLQAYTKETAEPVWDIMSLVIADTRRFIEYDGSLEDSIKELVRTLIAAEYKRLGWEEKDTDSPADQKLRATILGLGAYAEESSIITKAKALFEAYKNDTSAVSAELRDIVFTVVVKENVTGAVEYLLDLYKQTNNSDLQRDISGALTATRSPETAQQLLSLVTDPKIIKPQDADRWVFYLLRNRYVREIAWQWMEDNWSWVESTYASDKSFDYWPRYAASVVATKKWQEKYVRFFTPKLDQPLLRRNIEIGFEEIQARINWLERDLRGVQDFFQNL